MNAIDSLMEEANNLGRCSRSNFEPAIEIMASVETKVQEFINAALYLHDQFSRMIVFHIEYIVPTEKEKNETTDRSDNASPQEMSYLMNIGAVNIYSIEGVLNNTLSGFEAQMASIAEIYAPNTFSDGQQIVIPEDNTVQVEKKLRTGVKDEYRSILTYERKEMNFDNSVSLGMGNDSLYQNLKNSAFMINGLRTSPLQSAGVAGYFSFSEQLNNPIIGYEISDSSLLQDTLTPLISGSTIDEQRNVMYSDQRIIEIPAFIPHQKISTPSEEAAINVEKISNVIAKESHRQSLPTLISPQASLSRAFETISKYIAVASEVNNHMNSIMEQKGQEEDRLISQVSPMNLLLRNEDVTNAFSFDRIAYGESGSMKVGQMMNMIHGFAATEALQKSGSSAINEIILAAPSSRSPYQMPQATAVTRSMEAVLQVLSGSQRDFSSPRQSGRGTFNFNNTFDISVNVKSGKEESELRDLGRKIGLVLSEEIRRYGGMR